MATLTVTNEQLRLIEKALEFYARIGIGQFDKIKDHPTFENYIEKICIPNKDPEVGDITPQGTILEIKDGKALINGSVKNGKWCSDQEWKPIKNVKLSTDYSKYHNIRENVDRLFVEPRNLLYNEHWNSLNGGWGIYNPNVDESCRVSFDLEQVIRHEFWKSNPKHSNWTVDASVNLTTKDSSKIKCEIDG